MAGGFELLIGHIKRVVVHRFSDILGDGDGQGDPGGDLPRSARGCRGDDTEEAGGEELGGRERGRTVACDVLHE